MSRFPVKVVVTIFLVLSFTSKSYPAENSLDSVASASDTTFSEMLKADTPIGHTWLSLSLGEKIALLTGYKISCQEEVAIIQSRPTQPTHELQKIRLEKKAIIRYLIRHLVDNRQQFIQAIDRYYSRQDHQQRPLSDAIEFAHRSVSQQ